MNASDRDLKVRLLVILSLLLFVPFTLLAGLEDDLRSALRDAGWCVVSMEEMPVLVPEAGVTFEIRNLGRLSAGESVLDLGLLHDGAAYADVRLVVRLSPAASGEEAVPSAAAVPAAVGECLIKAGDPVEIIFHSGAVVIRSPGRALACGRRGEETEAINLSFNSRVRGIVSDGRRIILK